MGMSNTMSVLTVLVSVCGIMSLVTARIVPAGQGTQVDIVPLDQPTGWDPEQAKQQNTSRTTSNETSPVWGEGGDGTTTPGPDPNTVTPSWSNPTVTPSTMKRWQGDPTTTPSYWNPNTTTPSYEEVMGTTDTAGTGPGLRAEPSIEIPADTQYTPGNSAANNQGTSSNNPVDPAQSLLQPISNMPLEPATNPGGPSEGSQSPSEPSTGLSQVDIVGDQVPYDASLASGFDTSLLNSPADQSPSFDAQATDATVSGDQFPQSLQVGLGELTFDPRVQEAGLPVDELPPTREELLSLAIVKNGVKVDIPFEAPPFESTANPSPEPRSPNQPKPLEVNTASVSPADLQPPSSPSEPEPASFQQVPEEKPMNPSQPAVDLPPPPPIGNVPVEFGLPPPFEASSDPTFNTDNSGQIPPRQDPVQIGSISLDQAQSIQGKEPTVPAYFGEVEFPADQRVPATEVSNAGSENPPMPLDTETGGQPMTEPLTDGLPVGFGLQRSASVPAVPSVREPPSTGYESLPAAEGSVTGSPSVQGVGIPLVDLAEEAMQGLPIDFGEPIPDAPTKSNDGQVQAQSGQLTDYSAASQTDQGQPPVTSPEQVQTDFNQPPVAPQKPDILIQPSEATAPESAIPLVEPATIPSDPALPPVDQVDPAKIPSEPELPSVDQVDPASISPEPALPTVDQVDPAAVPTEPVIPPVDQVDPAAISPEPALPPVDQVDPASISPEPALPPVDQVDPASLSPEPALPPVDEVDPAAMSSEPALPPVDEVDPAAAIPSDPALPPEDQVDPAVFPSDPSLPPVDQVDPATIPSEPVIPPVDQVDPAAIHPEPALPPVDEVDPVAIPTEELPPVDHVDPAEPVHPPTDQIDPAAMTSEPVIPPVDQVDPAAISPEPALPTVDEVDPAVFPSDPTLPPVDQVDPGAIPSEPGLPTVDEVDPASIPSEPALPPADQVDPALISPEPALPQVDHVDPAFISSEPVPEPVDLVDPAAMPSEPVRSYVDQASSPSDLGPQTSELITDSYVDPQLPTTVDGTPLEPSVPQQGVVGVPVDFGSPFLDVIPEQPPTDSVGPSSESPQPKDIVISGDPEYRPVDGLSGEPLVDQSQSITGTSVDLSSPVLEATQQTLNTDPLVSDVAGGVAVEIGASDMGGFVSGVPSTGPSLSTVEYLPQNQEEFTTNSFGSVAGVPSADGFSVELRKPDMEDRTKDQKDSAFIDPRTDARATFDQQAAQDSLFIEPQPPVVSPTGGPTPVDPTFAEQTSMTQEPTTQPYSGQFQEQPGPDRMSEFPPSQGIETSSTQWQETLAQHPGGVLVPMDGQFGPGVDVVGDGFVDPGYDAGYQLPSEPLKSGQDLLVDVVSFPDPPAPPTIAPTTTTTIPPTSTTTTTPPPTTTTTTTTPPPTTTTTTTTPPPTTTTTTTAASTTTTTLSPIMRRLEAMAKLLRSRGIPVEIDENGKLKFIDETTTSTTTTTTTTTTLPTTTTTATTTTTVATTTMPVLTETTTSLSTAEIEALCESPSYIDSVGYAAYPGQCNKVVQCFQMRGGKIYALVRECPYGLFWEPSLNLCKHPAAVESCYEDPCLDFELWDYKRGKSCRAYSECYRGMSYPQCCQMGFEYRSDAGCVPNPSCRDPCETPETITQKLQYSSCKFLPDAVNPFGYQTLEHDGVRFRACAPGTMFSESQCGCVAISSRVRQRQGTQHRGNRQRRPKVGQAVVKNVCMPDFYMNFNDDVFRETSGTRTAYGVTNVMLNNGAAEFKGEGNIILWGFMDRDLGREFAVRLRFKVDANRSPGNILSNCGMHGDPTVSIRVDKMLVVFLIKTVSRPEATVIRMPYKYNDWNDVILYYNGDQVICGINDRKIRRSLSGEIETRSNAIYIGGCPSEGNGFEGLLDEISIYSTCIPQVSLMSTNSVKPVLNSSFVNGRINGQF